MWWGVRRRARDVLLRPDAFVMMVQLHNRPKCTETPPTSPFVEGTNGEPDRFVRHLALLALIDESYIKT